MFHSRHSMETFVSIWKDNSKPWNNIWKDEKDPMSHGRQSGKTHTGPEGRQNTALLWTSLTLILSSFVSRMTYLIWAKTAKLTALPHKKPCGRMFPWQQPREMHAAMIRGTQWKSEIITTAQQKRKSCMSQGWSTFCSKKKTKRNPTRRLMAVKLWRLLFRDDKVLRWPRKSLQ